MEVARSQGLQVNLGVADLSVAAVAEHHEQKDAADGISEVQGVRVFRVSG